MNNWNEKTVAEKVATIISGIALAVWIVFEYLADKSTIAFADTISCIAITIVCACEAVVFWRTKRVFSYVAIAGALCVIAAVVLLAVL